MTLAVLVVLSQIADGLAYVLASAVRIEYRLTEVVAIRMGTELNPIMAAIGAPLPVLLIKIGLGFALGLGSIALLRREAAAAPAWTHVSGRVVVSWIAVVGFVGALTEVSAL